MTVRFRSKAEFGLDTAPARAGQRLQCADAILSPHPTIVVSNRYRHPRGDQHRSRCSAWRCLVCIGGFASCSNVVLSPTRSPDGSKAVFVFWQECNATVPDSMYASIGSSGLPFSPDRNQAPWLRRCCPVGAGMMFSKSL